MEVKETIYKASGTYGRIKAAVTAIIGIGLIPLGIFFAVSTSQSTPLVLSGFGVIMIAYSWFLWKRCRPLLEGKFM